MCVCVCVCLCVFLSLKESGAKNETEKENTYRTRMNYPARQQRLFECRLEGRSRNERPDAAAGSRDLRHSRTRLRTQVRGRRQNPCQEKGTDK